MSAQVTELVTKFSFKGNLSPLNKFNGGLGKAIKGLGVYAAVVKASAGAVMAFSAKILRGADAQVQLSRNTGVAIERIQELQYAAEQTGASAGALDSSLSGLTDSIGKAAREGNAEFSRLGISVRDANGQIKSTEKVLAEVSHRFQTMNLSMNEKRNIASSLGIDKSLVNMLNTSASAMAAFSAEARAFGVITSKQQGVIKDFNTQFTRMKFALKGLGNQLAISIGPIITATIKKFVDWLLANKELIKSGFEKLSAALFVISGGIDRLIGFIFGVIDAMGGWGNALIWLGILFMTTPIGRFIAIITAIILIIDDLIIAFKGGESVIRDFFLSFFGIDITPILQGIVEKVKWIYGKIGEILSGIKDIFVGVFTLDGDKILEGVKKIFSAIFDLAKFWVGNIADIVLKPFKKIANFFGFGDDSGEGSPKANNMMPGGDPSFDPSMYADILDPSINYALPASSGSTSNEVNQTNNINIMSTDPVLAGQTAAEGINSHLDDTEAQLSMRNS